MELVTSVLTDSQVELFQRMQTSDQAHSVMVQNELRKDGEENPDLLTAALLHDVGKTRAPLGIWERVMIVIVGTICRDCTHEWGNCENVQPENGLGWRRAFIVAEQHPAWGADLAAECGTSPLEQHPAWGADLAAECGTSPLAVSLIARHQEKLAPDVSSMEDILLHKLQAVDDNN
jgi:hypothetical protein